MIIVLTVLLLLVSISFACFVAYFIKYRRDVASSEIAMMHVLNGLEDLLTDAQEDFLDAKEAWETGLTEREENFEQELGSLQILLDRYKDANENLSAQLDVLAGEYAATHLMLTTHGTNCLPDLAEMRALAL